MILATTERDLSVHSIPWQPRWPTGITPGTFISKAATNEWAAGVNSKASLPSLPTGILPGEGPFSGQYALHKTDERSFEGYRYRIFDGERLLLEGKTSETGQTGRVSTERAQFIEVHKAIMRDDQKITEDWAGYVSGTLSGASAPSRDPIPEDYLVYFEGAA